MITLILFLIVIGVLVFVHELGHFLAAKLSNIQVDSFAIGFGPKLFSFKKGETEYRINLLPFGGYVKMAGEGEYTDDKEKEPIINPRGFEIQPAWKKIIVILAGVVMNFILACVIYTGFMISSNFTQFVPQIVPNHFPFGTVTPRVGFQSDPSDKNSPIHKYNLKSSFVFDSINGVFIHDVNDISRVLKDNSGKLLTIKFSTTEGKQMEPIQLTARETPPKGKGAIGVQISPIAQISFDGILKPISGILYAADMLQYNASALITLISQAIQTKTASIVTNNLTGPVGIYEVTGIVFQQQGIAGILNIIGLLSLALALMNILPLPVLDGGFAVMIIIESISKRQIPANIKIWINNIGIGVLIAMMIFVTYNDINNFDIVAKVIKLFHH